MDTESEGKEMPNSEAGVGVGTKSLGDRRLMCLVGLERRS